MQASNGVCNGTMQKPLQDQGDGGRFKLSEKGFKLFLRAELVGLCVLIAMVWGLLALPVFLFHLSPVSYTACTHLPLMNNALYRLMEM